MDNLSLSGKKSRNNDDERELKESSEKAIEYFVGFVYAAIISVFLQIALTTDAFKLYQPISLSLPYKIIPLFQHLYSSNEIVLIPLFFLVFLAQDWAARVKVRYQVIRGPIPGFGFKILFELIAVFLLFVGFVLYILKINIFGVYLMLALFAITSQIWNYIIMRAVKRSLGIKSLRSTLISIVLRGEFNPKSIGVSFDKAEKFKDDLKKKIEGKSKDIENITDKIEGYVKDLAEDLHNTEKEIRLLVSLLRILKKISHGLEKVLTNP